MDGLLMMFVCFRLQGGPDTLTKAQFDQRFQEFITYAPIFDIIWQNKNSVPFFNFYIELH